MNHFDLDESATEVDPRHTPVRNRNRRDRGNRTSARHRAIARSIRWL